MRQRQVLVQAVPDVMVSSTLEHRSTLRLATINNAENSMSYSADMDVGKMISIKIVDNTGEMKTVFAVDD